MTTQEREAVIRAYVEALRAADLERMLVLFSPDGRVVSPLRGELPASTFYTDLFSDTRCSEVRVLHTLMDDSGPAAALELEYDWTLIDGGRVGFRCVDVFRFAPGGRLQELRIYYDAARVRPLYEAVRPPRGPERSAPS